MKTRKIPVDPNAFNALLQRARDGVFLADEQVTVADPPKYLPALAHLTYTTGKKETLKQFNNQLDQLLTQT